MPYHNIKKNTVNKNLSDNPFPNFVQPNLLRTQLPSILTDKVSSIYYKLEWYN